MIGIRVPRQALLDTASVKDFDGSGARGPVYGDVREVRCSMQPTTRLMAGSDGNVVTPDMLMIIRPEDGPVRVESRVSFGGTDYRVMRSYPFPHARRPSHHELYLERIAASAVGGSGS